MSNFPIEYKVLMEEVKLLGRDLIIVDGFPLLLFELPQ